MASLSAHPRAGRELRDLLSPLAFFRKLTLASQVKGYRAIQGWLTTSEAVHLYHFASRLDGSEQVILEIGSWKGKSTLCLARGLPAGTVYALDPFDAAGEAESKDLYTETRGATDLLEQFEKNMADHGVADRVVPLKGYSRDFVDTFDRIDLLFIDGDHSIEGCRFDFEHFGPKVSPGGYLLFHDYRPKDPDMGPTFVVDQLVLPSEWWRKVGLFDSLWVGQKKTVS